MPNTKNKRTLKTALAGNQLVLGSWITLAHASIPEIMADAGFDFLVVDMEHSVIDLSQAQMLIQAIEGCGVVPLVRVPENHPCTIKRVMDAGAKGIIVPMVNNARDAQNAVAAVKYPPLGSRGVGLARAQRYGYGFEKYKKWLADESVILTIVEHKDAIDNLESILNVEGIDGTLIGPYDLSASFGFPGCFDRVEFKQAMTRYEATCKEMGKTMGVHAVEPDPVKTADFFKKGYRFVAVGLDTLYLGHQCRQVMQQLKAPI